ncbi:MAG: histidine kinase [Flavobacteriaceae bacterium]|nr:histidine kinase [Flavobacteriaceae bacterium]
MKYLVYIVLFFISLSVFSQNEVYSSKSFYLKGEVLLKESSSPIPDVEIQVFGGSYTKTSLSGNFRLKVKIGDEIIISHPDIETVRYVLKNNDDRLKVYVEELKENKKALTLKRKNSDAKTFKRLIKSAGKVYKTDAKQGVELVTKSLLISTKLSNEQRSSAYGVLGDIYFHWKQYDLAITNYTRSLGYKKKVGIQLSLAESYFKNHDFDIAISTYDSINKSVLSNWQKIVLNEELGDVYAAKNEFSTAEKYYNKGLVIANKHLISPKITDLNSKLGRVTFSQGKVKEASRYFDNSLDLSSRENVQRAAVEKGRVADFYNSNQQFEQEIALRKKNLTALESIAVEVLTENSLNQPDSLTTQKSNYKIASAYVQQAKYNDAIPYLEKSISEANKKSDLIIEKDATRKLSEVYKTVGEYTKALETYQSYVDLVDLVYLKKEQQIANVSKVARDLIKQQQRVVGLEDERKLSENKLLLASKDNELQNERNKQQSIIIYSLLAGLLLLLLVAFYMYRNIKQQRINNNLLALKSLRSQMNPHFIFNALNSVNSFIASNDERRANRYLTDFSKLMRSVLENSEEDFIPLSKEIELLQLYTKLEHFRFQDKFDYNITVDEAINVDDFLIPPMLLQPYIENAVWHGLRYKEEKGLLQISLKIREDNELQIVIEDNGIGRSKSKALKTTHQKNQNSKGMGNIKKRVAILNEMYADKVDVFIEDIPNDGGTKVVLTLKKN